MIKKNLPLMLISTLLLCASCSGIAEKFTREEREIIDAGGGTIMRLWRVDNPQDSLSLRKVSEELAPGHIKSPEFGLLKSGMLATVNDPANSGVGIAAPQVGIRRRLIAVQRFDKEDEPFEFYINPKITWYSPLKQSGIEGCLSIPDFNAEVERSQEVEISYMDEATGRTVTEKVDGFTAIIFQHEVDHLEGVLFPDKCP